MNAFTFSFFIYVILESLVNGERRLFIIWKYFWPNTVIRGRPFIYFLTNIPRRAFIWYRPLIYLFLSPTTLLILYFATSRFSTCMCIFDVFDIRSAIYLNNFESLAMEWLLFARRKPIIDVLWSRLAATLMIWPTTRKFLDVLPQREYFLLFLFFIITFYLYKITSNSCSMVKVIILSAYPYDLAPQPCFCYSFHVFLRTMSSFL